MIGLAPSIMHWSGRPAAGSASGAAIGDLIPLLKVRTIHAVLVGLLVVLQFWFQLAASLSQQPRLLLELFVGMFEYDVVYFIIGFAIIAVAQQRIAPGRTRTVALIPTLLVWEGLYTLWVANSRFIVVELGLVTQAGSIVNGLWTNTIYMLLAAWYYESADRARRSAAVLRESELARKGAERWLLELRLSSLQARLDPRVLFDTLDEAGHLYRSRPAAAEQLLDALIDYLRRALPQLRQTESTLEREVELGLAYARILRTPEGEALELEAVVEPMAGDARFPPMVVQPLCDALARSALASGEPARLRISATRDADRARLRVTGEPVHAIPAGERFAEVRRTLQAMFAPLVRMESTRSAASMASVLVEVPYVAAPRVDR